MKRLDTEEAKERYLKALVYGRPGTGKTGFGVSAPRPLILLSERQGYPHVVEAARRLGKAIPPVLFMETIDDYRLVVRALHGDRAKPFVVRADDGASIYEGEWPSTVVLDSLTDACQRLIDDIRRTAPPKDGKDGLPVDSDRFWNTLSDRFSKLVHMFRDAPMNALFLCLLDERITVDDDDEDKKTRWIGPQLAMRKFPGVIQAAVNVVGVTYRKTAPRVAGQDRELVYGISTTGPDFMELKPFRPLRDQEVMDFGSWCDRINGRTTAPTAAPPAPEIADVVAAPEPDVAKEVEPEKGGVDFAKRTKRKEPIEPSTEVAP